MSRLMYTVEAQTVLNDPVYHSNVRCEFQIDKNIVLLSNLRLGNVGCLTTAGNTSNYDINAGVYQLIQNIYLMDGGTVLDSMHDVQHIMAFKNCVQKNDKNMSLYQGLLLHKLGFLQQDATVQTYTNPTISGQITEDPNTTAEGYIGLSDVLKMLNATTYLSTSVFKDLRLVIEWATSSLPANFSSVIRPVLMYDRLTNEAVVNQLMPKLKKTVLQFTPLEEDVVYLNAVANAGSASQNFNLKAFDGKTLTKVALLKDQNTLGSNRARSGYEKLNFVVNGRQLLPYDGIAKNNQKLSLLTDSWGVVNSIYTQNNVKGFFVGLTFANNVNQNRDFIGCTISEKINDLQLNYSVTNGSGANFLGQTLRVVGEVVKAIVVDGDTYNVVYL